MAAPELAKNAVFIPSNFIDANSIPVRGYDFNDEFNFDNLMQSYKSMGLQGTSLANAIDEINRMIDWRLSNEPISEDEQEDFKDPTVRNATKCKIFLAYTSNLVSSGTREILRYLVEHKRVDVIVTTAGGIEEDFIKCLAPTFLGDFHLQGKELRKKGLNRIGNMIVPNDNYCKFEDWVMPILDQMLLEQKEQNIIWSPSKMIHRLGKEINHPSSIYYWAYKHNIPVFSPALTDGSLGDMIYFHSFKNPGLILDIAYDIRAINSEAVFARKTGVIILGGGVVKHHTLNANLMVRFSKSLY